MEYYMMPKQLRHESKTLRGSAREQVITHEKVKTLFEYDKETGCLIWKKLAVKNQVKEGSAAGYLTDRGYIRVDIEGAQYYIHRIIWLFVYGEFPSGHIDHINHNRADNRISNMRDVCRIINGQNRSKGKNNISGVCGVGWHKQKQQWQARITINKKLVHLGSFNKFDDAVAVRKNAEIKYGFHPNHGA